MKYSEDAVTFACADETLVGVFALPTDGAAQTGVVVIVGGPQYRAGSHRQFLLLSRALANAGFAVLRFDYRGMGDSGGTLHDFSQVSEDIGSAIDKLLSKAPTVKKVVLWGLCDGASAALLYCEKMQDNRVRGLCLVNPWIRSASSLARTRVKHYYLQRLRQKEFWAKLLRGKVAASATAGLWRNVRQMAGSLPAVAQAQQLPFQDRMATGWGSFGGNVLLVLSGNDYTAKEFIEYVAMKPNWAGKLENPQVVRNDVVGADHTFSETAARVKVETLTVAWLRTHMAP